MALMLTFSNATTVNERAFSRSAGVSPCRRTTKARQELSETRFNSQKPFRHACRRLACAPTESALV
jgi:hypothetical protein